MTENVSVDMDDATVPAGKGNSDTRYAGIKRLELPDVGKLSRDRRFSRLSPPWELGSRSAVAFQITEAIRPSLNCFPGYRVIVVVALLRGMVACKVAITI